MKVEQLINFKRLDATRYGQLLNNKQKKEIKQILNLFVHRAYLKYAKGAVEHHGDMEQMTPSVLLSELENEIIDLMVYRAVLETKVNKPTYSEVFKVRKWVSSIPKTKK